MSKEDLKRFLVDLKSNKELFENISNVGTANEIALIANKFGYKFTIFRCLILYSGVVNSTIQISNIRYKIEINDSVKWLIHI